MKSAQKRHTESLFENVFLIVFTLLVLGSFNAIVSPLSGLDSTLLERAVQISLLLVVVLGALGFSEGF